MRITLAATALATCAFAWTCAAQAQTQSCARPAPGSVVAPPPALYSKDGLLSLAFNYVTNLDAAGRTLYCYVTPNGLESPTLHIKPGETLRIALTNRVSGSGAAMAGMGGQLDIAKVCGDKVMQAQAVNLHFHGANVAPTCGSDEVIHTLINPGSSFTYTVKFPKDEPPGLYWYHPHVHGISSRAVEGGATGVIVVDGIEQTQPKVAGLPERILVVRDQAVTVQPGAPRKRAGRDEKEPSWDLSLNYVPVSFPQLVPAEIRMAAGQKEFWRVANTASNTVADLQLKYDGVVQTVQLVALDGVAIGSQDGTRRGKTLDLTDVYIPPGGRAEFIVTAPGLSVKHATLTSAHIDTGPTGDIDTKRVLAVLKPDWVLAPSLPVLPLQARASEAVAQRFEGLNEAPVTSRRHLVFSEITTDPGDPNDGLFFISLAGTLPKVFDPNAPPAITTTQGAVEDWTIENQSQEVHEFHIHQIHFQLRAINGVPVDAGQRQIRDTIQVPYWTGKGPYPSVTLRMDFRGDVVGDFVYHCHILDHEDRGMMAIVRVLPKS